jgi:hypothetical protein
MTPTLAGMILQMKAEKKKVASIARELNLSRQTMYDVLRRASSGRHCRFSPGLIGRNKVWAWFHHRVRWTTDAPEFLPRRRCKGRAGRPAPAAVWPGIFVTDSGGGKSAASIITGFSLLLAVLRCTSFQARRQ